MQPREMRRRAAVRPRGGQAVSRLARFGAAGRNPWLPPGGAVIEQVRTTLQHKSRRLQLQCVRQSGRSAGPLPQVHRPPPEV